MVHKSSFSSLSNRYYSQIRIVYMQLFDSDFAWPYLMQKAFRLVTHRLTLTKYLQSYVFRCYFFYFDSICDSFSAIAKKKIMRFKLISISWWINKKNSSLKGAKLNYFYDIIYQIKITIFMYTVDNRNMDNLF